jgi:hypothetical protein
MQILYIRSTFSSLLWFSGGSHILETLKIEPEAYRANLKV